MGSPFAELHDELRASTRDLLAGVGAGRALAWSRAADAGWGGLEVPERLGGAGATYTELAVVLEELGRSATSTPVIGTAVLGVGLLQALPPAPERDELLRQVAAGETVVAVALSDGAVDAVPPTPAFRLEAGRLSGTASFVPDAGRAQRLLLLAVDVPAGDVVAVAVAPADVEVTPQEVLDATRDVAHVRADAVAVDPGQVWRVPAGTGAALHDRAALAVACDSLGLSEAMLAATVSYAGVREQFGRPVGSFQAVKHQCADMLARVTLGRELVEHALALHVDRDPGAPPAVSMAKAWTCDSAVDVVGRAVQLHGGIGYTWESGLHVYLKRAALDRALFGSPAAHRRRIAQRYLAATHG